jgi:hypothetical protein
MKSFLITFAFLGTTFLSGCSLSSVPQEETVLMDDELRERIQERIKTLPEYRDGGSHLEEVKIMPASCLNCFYFVYEFRVQDENAEVVQVLQAKVNVENDKIKNILVEAQ